MKDEFKRETMVGFTVWDLNAKCVIVKKTEKRPLKWSSVPREEN